MSISIPENAQLAYNTVLKGDPKVEWAIFSLASAGNDLKLQATGSGLDDLEEEFMDGRIQYAFARVEDPGTNLEKFVQINWCGDGVAERQKGLFNTYGPQISSFLKSSHIVLQARNESDVTPDHIYKRMRESSGSKYGAGNAPSSTPSASSFAAPAAKPVPKPYTPASSSFSKPTPQPSTGSAYSRTIGSFGTPGKPAYQKPTPAPVPAREPTPPPPPAPEPVVPEPAKAVLDQKKEILAQDKPAEDDRIAPVGTAYEPVKLAAPKKLVNRWGAGGFGSNSNNNDEEKEEEKTGGFAAARNMFSGGGGAPRATSGGFGGGASAAGATGVAAGIGAGQGKKLTWSERQAEVKKQREAEEKAAEDAMAKVSISSNNTGSRGTAFNAPSSAPSFPPRAPAVIQQQVEEQEEEDVPPPPPPPPAPLPPRVPEPEETKEENEEDWDDAPPPPPAPPMPSRPVAPVQQEEPVEEEEEDEAPPPPPPAPPLPPFLMGSAEEEAPPPPPMASRPRPPAQAKAGAGLRAKAVYDYEAAEDNEIGFKEDDVITGVEQTDPDWWTGVDPTTGKKGLFPANYVELIEGDAAEVEEEEFVPPPPPAPPMPARAEAPAANKGKTAVAQYDYEATEGNEISFGEGDRIVSIEETDPDWWTGTNEKTGEIGLFPANYVELV